jgi:hypothetical protein
MSDDRSGFVDQSPTGDGDAPQKVHVLVPDEIGAHTTQVGTEPTNTPKPLSPDTEVDSVKFV